MDFYVVKIAAYKVQKHKEDNTGNYLYIVARKITW